MENLTNPNYQAIINGVNCSGCHLAAHCNQEASPIYPNINLREAIDAGVIPKKADASRLRFLLAGDCYGSLRSEQSGHAATII
ncbi:hypothetical protein GF362_00030 [Candidatus Dojkabacteria bacterium]|nr:hypothetical protein [Candidatus Dojkabacteria bacterium]